MAKQIWLSWVDAGMSLSCWMSHAGGPIKMRYHMDRIALDLTGCVLQRAVDKLACSSD